MRISSSIHQRGCLVSALVCERSASHCRTSGPPSITVMSLSGAFDRNLLTESLLEITRGPGRAPARMEADASADAGLMPFPGVPCPSAALGWLWNSFDHLYACGFLLRDNNGSCNFCSFERMNCSQGLIWTTWF